MFWIALSVMVMSMTGLGDDTRFFLVFVETLREAAAEEIEAPDRRQRAVSLLDDFRASYFEHRERLGRIGDCIEELDRTYEVTVEDYERCGKTYSNIMGNAAEVLIYTRTELRKATTPEERARVKERFEQ